MDQTQGPLNSEKKDSKGLLGRKEIAVGISICRKKPKNNAKNNDRKGENPQLFKEVRIARRKAFRNRKKIG